MNKSKEHITFKIIFIVLFGFFIWLASEIIIEIGNDLLNFTNVLFSQVISTFWKMLMTSFSCSLCIMLFFHFLQKTKFLLQLNPLSKTIFKVLLFLFSLPMLLSSIISGIAFIYFIYLY